jgi:predicted ATPase
MNAMQIADLRIENFRGIRTGHIRFGAHTVFIDPNNCGKTTVIEALALLFGAPTFCKPRRSSERSMRNTQRLVESVPAWSLAMRRLETVQSGKTVGRGLARQDRRLAL